MRSNTNPKVFCIGFHKTGTTSLAVALRSLGYRVTGPNWMNDPNIGDNVYKLAFDAVEKFDAFQDNPWPILYKELDQKYPGSKFILTIRSSNAWIGSQVRHFGERTTAMRKWIYGVGCPQGNEEIYIKRYESHNKEVIEYFRDRPNDFLIMDLAQGHGWDELCRFLDLEVPSLPFPHANKADHRDMKIARVWRLFRRWFGR